MWKHTDRVLPFLVPETSVSADLPATRSAQKEVKSPTTSTQNNGVSEKVEYLHDSSDSEKGPADEQEGEVVGDDSVDDSVVETGPPDDGDGSAPAEETPATASTTGTSEKLAIPGSGARIETEIYPDFYMINTDDELPGSDVGTYVGDDFLVPLCPVIDTVYLSTKQMLNLEVGQQFFPWKALPVCPRTRRAIAIAWTTELQEIARRHQDTSIADATLFGLLIYGPLHLPRKGHPTPGSWMYMEMQLAKHSYISLGIVDQPQCRRVIIYLLHLYKQYPLPDDGDYCDYITVESVNFLKHSTVVWAMLTCHLPLSCFLRCTTIRLLRSLQKLVVVNRGRTSVPHNTVTAKSWRVKPSITMSDG
jgi:hypothetical protein